MGLGLHGGGLSLVKWLVKHGALVTVTDLRDKTTLKSSLGALKGLKIKYVLGAHREEDFQKTEMVVQNPAVPNTSKYLFVAAKHDVPIENEATLFLKMCPGRIFGVTGTRGKSTTAAILASILKLHDERAVLCGNIRVITMFDVLDKIKKDQPVVVELSSWHLERLGHERLSPPIALVTNLMADHLNRYPNMEDYKAAKEQIVRWQKAGDLAVLNLDNLYSRKMSQITPAEKLFFSAGAGRYEEQGTFLVDDELIWRIKGQQKKLIKIEELGVAGAHNIINALGASAAALGVGVPIGAVRRALKAFHGLPYRQEFRREVGGVEYVNDSASTTPDATLAALAVWLVPGKRRVILIAGGEDKNLDYHVLAEQIMSDVKSLILLPGSATDKLLSLLPVKMPRQIARSMAEAVELSRLEAECGDTVILSPGAASFGMFLHEFDRGDQYNEAVERLT